MNVPLRLTRHAAILVLVSGLASCAGTLQESTIGPRGPIGCPVAADPLNPFIVEWHGTHKANLDNMSRNGVVVVSYENCELKVLDACQAGGSYQFKPVTAILDKMSIGNEDELYAKLPIGAASLTGELSKSEKLDLQYVVVGHREATKPAASLSGNCKRATHYVRKITMGAYGLDAVGTAKGSANGAVGVVGAGGQYSERIERIRA